MSDYESPQEIERDIEQTRANIDRTLSDLQYRLSPNTLINQALGSKRVKTTLHSAGSGTAGIAASLGRRMSSNPIPVLLTAVGLTWLAFSGSSSGNGKRRRELSGYDPGDLPRRVHEESGEVVGREDPSRGPRYEHVDDPTLDSSSTLRSSKMKVHNPGSSDWGDNPGGGSNGPLDPRTDAEVTEELKAKASQRRGSRIGERARGVAGSVSGRVGRVSETLSEGVERMTGVMKSSGGAYDTTRGVASRATHAVRSVPARVGDAYHSAGDLIQSNPIAAGAVAIALGAALALLIPSTRRERRLIGEASDEVKASVRDSVVETVDRAKDVVRSATEAATDAARRGVKGEVTSGEPAPASADIDISTGAVPSPGAEGQPMGPTEGEKV